jgi:hypothetical protein
MSHADRWKKIAEKLQREIEHCETVNTETVPCIECCFRISTSLYHELICETLERGFECEIERRHFVKTVLPKAASRVEYYRLVHYYELFKPPKDSEPFAEFYQRELKRIEIFLEHHQVFVNYYISGRTDLDEVYFNEVEMPDELTLVITEKAISKDAYNIIAIRLLALMDFHIYLKNQLHEN